MRHIAMRNAFFFLLVALNLCTTPASAQVYKWVDESGRTQYSNVAPFRSLKGVSELVPPRPPVYVPLPEVPGFYANTPMIGTGAPVVTYGARPSLALAIQAAIDSCVSQHGVD